MPSQAGPEFALTRVQPMRRTRDLWRRFDRAKNPGLDPIFRRRSQLRWSAVAVKVAARMLKLSEIISGRVRTPWAWRNTRALRTVQSTVHQQAALVHDFEQALAGISTPESIILRHRIRAAKSKPDLWYLRSNVFDLVSHALGQREAQSRLDLLNELFDSGGAKTGPTPL